MSNRIRCAIYTRKSTEDGLEQSFNSLHAQREACEAYVKSQCGMNWVALPTDYDDGGISGGTLERPALQRLLADIAARKVDLVVVYKVDRLTRSLSDFAKIVEVFDASGVSFVSVTQQFNTTTSMGRLTLNMLLSFAQFEREVTGERIRDKIAASKKKGMWTGGPVPLGYDVHEKQLSINAEEAETVRALFRLYLECSTVQELIDRARGAGLVTKQRRFSDGRVAGGRLFTRGHLYQLLSNPLYVGEVAHREARHSGRHQAIIDRALFDAVQRRLKANRVRRQAQKNADTPSLLTGLVFDEVGDRLCPTHASKSGRRYHYYTSQRLIHRADPSAQGWRLPARELEQAVIDPVATLLRDAGRLMEALPAGGTPDQLRQVLDRARDVAETLQSDPAEQRLLLKRLVRRVIVSATSLCLEVSRQGLLEIVFPDAALQPIDGEFIKLTAAFQVRRRGRQARLVVGEARASRRPDPTLVVLVAKAHHWFSQLATGAASSIRELAVLARVHPSDIGRVLPLAFLAPDIVEAILTGAQPTELTAWRLKRLRTLPMAWESQRQALGF